MHSFFLRRLLAENDKIRARNLVLESRQLDASMRETVILRRSKTDFTDLGRKSFKGDTDSSFLGDFSGAQKSLSIDSLEKEKYEKKRENSNEKDVVKEVELEVDLNVLEGGRSARLCAKLKKVAQEKEILRQVRA